MEPIAYEDLASDLQTTLVRAEYAREKAYHPHSKLLAGAAFRTRGGKIIAGANFLTICAERVAVVSAHMEGTCASILDLVITARSEAVESTIPGVPCKACRQVLLEVADISDNDFGIYLCSTDRKHIIKTSITELFSLPVSLIDLSIYLSQGQ